MTKERLQDTTATLPCLARKNYCHHNSTFAFSEKLTESLQERQDEGDVSLKTTKLQNEWRLPKGVPEKGLFQSSIFSKQHGKIHPLISIHKEQSYLITSSFLLDYKPIPFIMLETSGAGSSNHSKQSWRFARHTKSKNSKWTIRWCAARGCGGIPPDVPSRLRDNWTSNL